MYNRATEFIIWWLVKFPKRLFHISRNFLSLVNNELSFFLTIRLLFTPLFGDYTIVGRAMGLMYRTVKLLLSIPILLFLAFVTFTLPVLWYFMPLVLIYYLEFWFVPVFILHFVFWELLRSNVPLQRVASVKRDSASLAMRPHAKVYLNTFSDFDAKHLLQMLCERDMQDLLKRTETSAEQLVERFVSQNVKFKFEDLLATSYEYAIQTKCRYIEMEHLLLAVLKNTPKYDVLLAALGSKLSHFEAAVQWTLEDREHLAKVHFWQEDYEPPIMGGTNRGMTGRVTKYLDSFSVDFTEMAKYGKFKRLLARTGPLEQIADILSGSTTENVIITGSPGSGKSSLVKCLAHQVVHGTKYDSLKFKRIVSLDTGSLIAGARTSGEVAERIQKLMKDVESSKDIILFIDEIHNLIAADNGGNSETASPFTVFEPYLSSGKNQFIAATSAQNYRKYIEPVGSFSRLFSVVEIPESSVEETLDILKIVARDFEHSYNIVISYPALVRTIELSKRLIHERVFPDKAIDVLNRACASVSKKKREVTAEDVAMEISQITHVPVSSLTQEETAKLLKIEELMRQDVIGQDPAIIQIGAALKRARVGIRDEGKPIASFLFVGTTGVGKTQTAKALAKAYFGDSKNMVRLDMSEYQQQDSINRLVGSPDGKTKGILTEAVRTRPFALILLDEIEKAYSNILLTFLQVLDDGRLTDSSGLTIDFTNTIIIATSNVGTRAIQEISANGGSFEDMKDAAMKDVHSKYAPEFLNRFNGVIVFKPLDVPAVRKIADLVLNRVRKMAEEKGIKVSFKPELIDELTRRGFNPELGARPLARVIEEYVETYLAVKLLANELTLGDEVSLGLEVFEEPKL